MGTHHSDDDNATPFAVVGVLRRGDGRVLAHSRPGGPRGQDARWEFPGGKIEPGETAREALAREMNEEIGITVTSVCHLLTLCDPRSQSGRWVEIYEITQWTGKPRGEEGQTVQWLEPEQLRARATMPGCVPVLEHLERAAG